MAAGMSRLLHDRYYAYASNHAWDLATGESVPIDTIATAPASMAPLLDVFAEALDHGRDGEPRWIVVDTASGHSSLGVARRLAEDGRQRGFVPIAVDVYLRLRTLLDEELRHRTLMLILPPGSSLEPAREAILAAAAVSPRPHVLVSFRGVRTGHFVREARAAYGAGVQLRPVLPSLPDDVARHVARGSHWIDLWQAGRHAAAERLLRDVAGAVLRRRALAPAATTFITLGRLLLERGRAADADSIFAEAAMHAQAA